MWNTVLNINSIFCAIACWYAIYAAGASIYFLTWRPLEIGIMLVLILIVTEVIFGALSD